MDNIEKVACLLNAKDDAELDAAIAALTEKQKCLVINACIRFLNGNSIEKVSRIDR